MTYSYAETQPANGSGDTGGAPGLHVFADLAVNLGKVAKAMSESSRRLAALSAAPIDSRFGIALAAPSGGGTFIVGTQLLDPSIGRVQVLRRCTLGGVSWGTSASGTAILVQSGSVPQAGNLDTQSVVDVFSALPAVHFYSSRQVVVRGSDNLYVVFLSSTGSQVYTASVQFEDYAEGAYEGVIGL